MGIVSPDLMVSPDFHPDFHKIIDVLFNFIEPIPNTFCVLQATGCEKYGIRRLLHNRSFGVWLQIDMFHMRFDRRILTYPWPYVGNNSV